MKFHHLFMAATLAALTSCSERNPQSSTETPIRVRTYFPAISHEGELLVSGTVSARQTAVISTKVMGSIEKIHIRQGDHVRQGQTLATINSGDLKAKEAQAQAMIAEARAAAHDAEKDHQRYQTLHTQKSVSDKELENVALRAASARARLQMARQGLNEMRAMLAYARIRAPFSGTVTQKMVDEGTIANPGMPLLAIEQSGELNVTAAIPESYITRVKPGDKVRVEVKAAGLTADGTVSELSPSAAMTGGQYAMKVSIPQVDRQKLRAGMYAGVRLAGKSSSDGTAQIWINRSSVVTKDQLTGVYVVGNDNRAVLHWVRLGQASGDRQAVLSGLKPDDRIIEAGHARLYNGQKVSFAN